MRIERDLWQSGLDALFRRDSEQVRDRSLRTDQRKYRYEYDVKPTERDFEELVENWYQRQDQRELNERTDFENVGFVLEGESHKVYWLSDALVKKEMELDLTQANDEIVVYESLQEALSEKRGELVEMLLTA